MCEDCIFRSSASFHIRDLYVAVLVPCVPITQSGFTSLGITGWKNNRVQHLEHKSATEPPTGVQIGANWTSNFWSYKSASSFCLESHCANRDESFPLRTFSVCVADQNQPFLLQFRLFNSQLSVWVNVSTSTKILSDLSLAYRIR